MSCRRRLEEGLRPLRISETVVRAGSYRKSTGPAVLGHDTVVRYILAASPSGLKATISTTLAVTRLIYPCTDELRDCESCLGVACKPCSGDPHRCNHISNHTATRPPHRGPTSVLSGLLLFVLSPLGRDRQSACRSIKVRLYSHTAPVQREYQSLCGDGSICPLLVSCSNSTPHGINKSPA